MKKNPMKNKDEYYLKWSPLILLNLCAGLVSCSTGNSETMFQSSRYIGLCGKIQGVSINLKLEGRFGHCLEKVKIHLGQKKVKNSLMSFFKSLERRIVHKYPSFRFYVTFLRLVDFGCINKGFLKYDKIL